MKWIAFLRGVNVGGKNKLPMAELRVALEAVGFAQVQTYIQSGNIVFEATGTTIDFVTKIRGVIEANFGFGPQVLVLSEEDLREAISKNPFPVDEAMGNLLHLFFLSDRAANADLVRLDALKTDSEKWLLSGRVFYLSAPDGVARSKLFAGAEKALGVPTTARNWRTVKKLAAMAK